MLLAPDGTADPYFAEFGWVAGDANVKVPGNDTHWTSSGGALTPDHPVDLTWDNGAGLRFTRALRDRQRLHVHADPERRQQLGPRRSRSIPTRFVARKGEVPVSTTYLLHVGPIGVFDDTLQDGYKYSAT